MSIAPPREDLVELLQNDTNPLNKEKNQEIIKRIQQKREREKTNQNYTERQEQTQLQLSRTEEQLRLLQQQFEQQKERGKKIKKAEEEYKKHINFICVSVVVVIIGLILSVAGSCLVGTNLIFLILVIPGVIIFLIGVGVFIHNVCSLCKLKKELAELKEY